MNHYIVLSNNKGYVGFPRHMRPNVEWGFFCYILYYLKNII